MVKKFWLVFSRVHWALLQQVLELIFRFIMPLAARLPWRVGMGVADALGWVCWRLDLDWRTVALREHYVKRRTRLAFQEIDPGLTARELDRAVCQRFVNASREELEGFWLARGLVNECRCDFAGLDAIKTHLRTGRGLVLLTLHFDATVMGIAQLGRVGLKLNPMSSNVVEDPRVTLSVRRFFERKYKGLELYLHGGKVLPVETHLRSIYAALQRGEGLVVLGEAPAGPVGDALLVNFLGHRRAVAPGAVRIAEKTGSAIAAFVCLRVSVGHYTVIFTPLLYPSGEQGHRHNAGTLFEFLDRQVRRSPERWWAADQLPNFVNQD